ncbi:type II toxin-antitoxin system YoeB family toxin [Phaeobacter sp. JH18-17]
MLALKGDLSGWWSRRITAEHRFVYRVSGKGDGQSLEIAQLRHNYCSIRLFATMLTIKKACSKAFAAAICLASAEGLWKLAWFLDDEDVSVDFVEAAGSRNTLASYTPERAESALLWRFLRCSLS